MGASLTDRRYRCAVLRGSTAVRSQRQRRVGLCVAIAARAIIVTKGTTCIPRAHSALDGSVIAAGLIAAISRHPLNGPH